MWPREHGAWSMLLQPFAAGLILFGASVPAWWMPLATLTAMLALFLLRQPLTVLARQRWVWKDRKPESSIAHRWVLTLAAVLAAAAWLHWRIWPLAGFLTFGAGSLLLTLAAVWLTIRNEQRSIWLQVVSAIGLTAGAPAIAITATGHIPLAAWILWLCSAVYCASGVLTVRALLECRIAARRSASAAGAAPVFRTPAWISQFVLLSMALAALWLVHLPCIALALTFIASLHIFRTLTQLQNPSLLSKPLTRIGWEAMAGSLVYTSLLVLGLGGVSV